MKICHIIEAAGGGSGRVVCDLARHAALAGHAVTVIYAPARAWPGFVDALQAVPTIRLIALPMQRQVGLHDAFAAWRLYQTLKTAGPFDILHAHSSKAGALMRLAGLFLPHAAKIYTPHGFISLSPMSHRFYRWAEWILSFVTDQIITVSRAEQRHARTLGIAARKIAYIPNGVTPADYLSRLEARQRLGLDPQACVIGFVGRLSAQKNPALALMAFARIATAHPDAQFCIIGAGALRNELQASRDTLDCRDRVHFYNTQEASQLLPAFDVLLCSSRYEGMPLLFLEALAAQVPIVTTPVGGAEEIIIDGQTGFIAADHTTEALAGALSALLALSPTQRAAMRPLLQAQAEQFSFARIAEATERLYRQLVLQKQNTLQRKLLGYRRLLLCLILLLGLYAIDARADAWPDAMTGSGLGVQVKPERTNDNTLTVIRQTGFHYLRFDMRWREVERQRGSYDWRQFDAFIARLRAHDLKAVIILNGGNPAYSGFVAVPPAEAFGTTQAPAAPADPDAQRAFASFAAAAVARYGTGDIIWEIWNEPDMLGFWPPKPDAEAFARLAELTCHAMRAVAPQAMIVAPGLARLPRRDDPAAKFLQTALTPQLANCLSAVSLHPYRLDRPPETVIADYRDQVRPNIAALRPRPLPILSSEWGYPTNKVSEKQQANYLLRMYLANLLSGVNLSIWYEWQDSRPGPAPEDVEAHFGLTNYDGSPKPAATALAIFLPQIADATIAQTLSNSDSPCFLLRLHYSDGHDRLLGWVDDKAMTQSYFTSRDGAAAQKNLLTSQPQLFADMPDVRIHCR